MRGAFPMRAAIFRRYVQFCLVGASGVAVDMFLIFLLASPAGLGWSLSLSKVIAAEVALLNNFIWNDLWTFRGLLPTTKTTKGPEPRDSALGASDRCNKVRSFRVLRVFRGSALTRLAKFNLICTAGIGLSVLLLNLQVWILHLNLYLANLLSIVLVSLWNFLLNLRFGWGYAPAGGCFSSSSSPSEARSCSPANCRRV